MNGFWILFTLVELLLGAIGKAKSAALPKSSRICRKYRHLRRIRALRFEFLEIRLAPATISWTGLAGDFDWTNGNNWSTHSVPGPFDDALINISVASPITITG